MENIPGDGTEILAFRPDVGVFAATRRPPSHEDGGWDEDAEPLLFTLAGEDISGDPPTHWHPLPPPPPEEG